MRCLVTRPEPDATATAERLAAGGHAAIVAPVLSVVFAPPQAVGEPGAVLVTSRNAVRALLTWPAHRQWLALPAYAVGPATGRALADAGFIDVRTGDGTGAGLATLVARTLRPDSGAILHPAARDRAVDIAGLLAGHGHDVRTVVAYSAEPVAQLPDAAQRALADGVDAILLYSRRSAKTFVQLANEAGFGGMLAEQQFLALSEQVAGAVRATGARIAVAARPDEDSLLALLHDGPL